MKGGKPKTNLYIQQRKLSRVSSYSERLANGYNEQAAEKMKDESDF